MQKPSMQAMILAAGLGTRLRPYTQLRPKPLLPVLDAPLLAAIVRQVRTAGFSPLMVNAFHLAEQVVAAFAAEPEVVVQVETREMGTGGGLRLALSHFGREPVLVVNGDVVHDIDLAWVYEEHRRSGNDVTMVMHDCPRFNTVRVAPDGSILGFAKPGAVGGATERLLAFTGIHVVEPRVLQQITPRVFCNIIDRYQQLIRENGAVRALCVRNHFWTDMGTPADYLALHGTLLAGASPPVFPAHLPGSRPFYVGNGVKLGKDVRLHDWVCIGSNAVIGDDAQLSRVVVWDGAQVAAGTRAVDAILT